MCGGAIPRVAADKEAAASVDADGIDSTADYATFQLEPPGPPMRGLTVMSQHSDKSTVPK